VSDVSSEGLVSWFVGIVGRGAHRVVERELAVLGVAAFYPRLRRWVTHARTKVAAERPLLDRYLFINVIDGQFGRLELVTGLRALLVSSDGAPAVIADEFVWGWRSRYMQGEFDLTVRDIPVGALVRIIEGEFADQVGRVVQSVRGRITVAPLGSTKVATMRFTLVTAAEQR
jgi:transcription antitermination factor NusG